MKQYTIGIFNTRTDAEKAINDLHNEMSISPNEISYIYKNTDGETKEVNPEEVTTNTTGENATKGAAIGGGIGVIAGLATVAGIIPVIGPIFVAGPLITALGIGAGALGSAAAGGVTGAAAGGLIGALVSLGTSKEKAQEYEDMVTAGNILVAVHADDTKNVATILSRHKATSVEGYSIP